MEDTSGQDIITKTYGGTTFHISPRRLAVSTPLQFFLIIGVNGKEKKELNRILRQAIMMDKVRSLGELFYYLKARNKDGQLIDNEPRLELLGSSYERFYTCRK